IESRLQKNTGRQICCAEWRWLSNWTVDHNLSPRNEGWLYSENSKDLATFKTGKSSKDRFRRRRLYRARFLDTPDNFNSEEYVFIAFKEFATDLIIRVARQTDIHDQNTFEERQFALYEAITITRFEKDVYTLFGNKEMRNCEITESQKIIKETETLFGIVLSGGKKKDMIERIQGYLDELTIYRSNANSKNRAVLS
ncbi:hypothetical protein MHBO_004315, partial [Bonamia ostreae]